MSEEVHHTLGKLEQGFLSLKETVERSIEQGTKRLDKHDDRLDAVEKRVIQASTLAGLAAVLLPLVPSMLRNMFNGS